jgi:hypothetical protein
VSSEPLEGWKEANVQLDVESDPAAMYRLVIAHVRRLQRATQLTMLVHDSLRSMIGRDDVLDVSSQLPQDHSEDSGTPTLIVLLGSRACRTDPAMQQLVTRAFERGCAVLPVYGDSDDFADVVPEQVRPLNGSAVGGRREGRPRSATTTVDQRGGTKGVSLLPPPRQPGAR